MSRRRTLPGNQAAGGIAGVEKYNRGHRTLSIKVVIPRRVTFVTSSGCCFSRRRTITHLLSDAPVIIRGRLIPPPSPSLPGGVTDFPLQIAPRTRGLRPDNRAKGGRTYKFATACRGQPPDYPTAARGYSASSVFRRHPMTKRPLDPQGAATRGGEKNIAADTSHGGLETKLDPRATPGRVMAARNYGRGGFGGKNRMYPFDKLSSPALATRRRRRSYRNFSPRTMPLLLSRIGRAHWSASHDEVYRRAGAQVNREWRISECRKAKEGLCRVATAIARDH